MTAKGHHFNIGVYLAALVVLVDQLSKTHFLAFVASHGPFYRVGAFLNLRLNWNEGVTFGLLNGYGLWMPYILCGVALVITLFLLRWLAQVKTLLSSLGLGFVVGGAIGNVIDRVRFGAVVDFIDLHYAEYHWYTFNMADSAIVAGVALLLLESAVLRRRNG